MPLTDEQLTRELRAIRPVPDPAFGARLDEWAAEGFPSANSRSAARRPRLRLTFPRLAIAVSLLLALVVSVGAIRTLSGDWIDQGPLSAGDDSGASVESGQAGDAARQSESAPPAGSAGAAIEPAPVGPQRTGDGQLLPGQPRIQQRDARMTLSTEPDRVAEVADEVVEVTERYEGIVASSNVNTTAERGRASFDLRIPTANLQAALADLSDLASIKERSEGSLDITAPYIGASERFADARAEVDALLAQLAEAGSADEIAEVRGQLRVARAELAAARAELADLKRRADFSTVSVAVVGEGDADGWSLGDAADDALSVLEDLTGAALIALAAILPLLLIALAAGFAYRLFLRRSRERALDD